MLIYTGTNGDPKKNARCRELGMGICFSGDERYRDLYEGMPLFLDNDAYGCWRRGQGFDEWLFLKNLSHLLRKKARIDFIVCPDIVAAGLVSLEFSLMWELRLRGHPLYLAVQDGMVESDLLECHGRFRGIFVGGTRKWKQETAEDWVKYAHGKGMQAHIGRVGTLDLLNWAERIGADSVDSTNFVRNGTLHIVDEYHEKKQKSLFGES